MKADERLEARRRDAEQRPEDPEAAARYEAELLRAGQGERLKERLRLDIVCSRRWEDLEPTFLRAKVRSCDQCQEKVYWVETEEELKRRTAKGQCVAVFDDKEALEDIKRGRGLRPRVLPLTIDQSLESIASDASAGEALTKPGCLVGGDRATPPAPHRGIRGAPPNPGPGLVARLVRRLKGGE